MERTCWHLYMGHCRETNWVGIDLQPRLYYVGHVKYALVPSSVVTDRVLYFDQPDNPDHDHDTRLQSSSVCPAVAMHRPSHSPKHFALVQSPAVRLPHPGHVAHVRDSGRSLYLISLLTPTPISPTTVYSSQRRCSRRSTSTRAWPIACRQDPLHLLAGLSRH